MAAIAGLWRTQNLVDPPVGRYATALQQGDGYSPIHGLRGGPGRATAPAGDQLSPIDDSLTTEEYRDGWSDEDTPDRIWGYGVQSGTADRPAWDENSDDGTRMDLSDGFPEWGNYEGGVPGGTIIRAVNRGADATNDMKLSPTVEPPVEEWVNKEHGTVEDATVSDPIQYVMQTSMLQRDQVRAGSQNSGTASEYSAPIPSRIPGKKLRFWPGGRRHGDMQPKEQSQTLRAYWLRTAGVGRISDMQVNQMYVSQPYTRVAPDNPYPGPQAVTDADVAGYTLEDQVLY